MLNRHTDRDSLKAMFSNGRGYRFMEAHNGLSALVACTTRDEATKAEFDGVWVSSLTCTAASALPDLELSIIDNRLRVISEIVETSSKPVVIDGDTGGDISSLRYFCRALERMGAAAVVVEEKAIPKRNSLDDASQGLADPHEFAAKLQASKEALRGPDFMVVARLESLTSGLGMEDALHRARIYAEAEVDGILVHSKSKDDGEVLEFAARFRQLYNHIPIFCVPTTYHAATAGGLFASGIQGVIYANHQLRAAHAAMRGACLSILKNDCSSAIESGITSTKQLFDEVGYTAEVARVTEIENGLRMRKREYGRTATAEHGLVPPH